jgi:hypothetical protein
MVVRFDRCPTTLQISCERKLASFTEYLGFFDFAMRTIRKPPSVRQLHLPDRRRLC